VSDKRKFKRVEFKEPVQYRVLGCDMPDFLPASFYSGTVSCDLGEGGIKFRSEKFIPIRALLAVEMTVAGGDMLALEGQVAWIQKIPHAESYFLGLEFVDSAENQSAIRQLRQYIMDYFLPPSAKN